MPRRLSDMEWSTFLNQVDVNSLNLPPWGGVVQWQDMYILVFICPSSGTLCSKGEAMLTDVSDISSRFTSYPRQYYSFWEVFVYNLPQQALAETYQIAKDTAIATGTIVTNVAKTAGEAAGAAVSPILQPLSPIIITALVLFGILYLPKVTK